MMEFLYMYHIYIFMRNREKVRRTTLNMRYRQDDVWLMFKCTHTHTHALHHITGLCEGCSNAVGIQCVEVIFKTIKISYARSNVYMDCPHHCNIYI